MQEREDGLQNIGLSDKKLSENNLCFFLSSVAELAVILK